MVENLHATKIEIDAAGALYREIGRGIAWKRNLFGDADLDDFWIGSVLFYAQPKQRKENPDG